MSKIIQLKISLDDSKRPIWRRFLVEDSITFRELHRIIQGVMGWKSNHLYDFLAGDVCVEASDEERLFVDAIWGAFRPTRKTAPADKTKLADLVKKKNQKITYRYDFGDNWRHALLVEKIMEKEGIQKHPICVAGEGACPPEDSGGTYGYEEMLNILKNKKHPEHKLWAEFAGNFDPHKFDINKINRALNKLRK